MPVRVAPPGPAERSSSGRNVGGILEIRGSMRELFIQLSLLNRQVSANLGFKDIDLD